MVDLQGNKKWSKMNNKILIDILIFWLGNLL